MDAEQLFLPPFLQSLGYSTLPELRELAGRAVVTETAERVLYSAVWEPWRGILEYLCSVEYAREMLKGLPKGRAIGSLNVVPARYHAASLVFFAQATLDNVAVWSSKRLALDIKGSDCAFHKSKFNLALKENVPVVAAAAQIHGPFIAKLERYRKEWIHRHTGGAQIYSDKSLSEPDAHIQIMVPIDPAIGQFQHDYPAYVKAVARTRTNNGGKWLYPVEEFADEITDGLKTFLISFLAAALAEPRFSATQSNS